MAGYNVASLSRLIEQFERMPGIGHKTAQRMAFYVLGLKGYKRTADLYHLKSFDGINKIQVWNAEFTEYGPSSVSDKVSWAGKYDNRYRIAFFDRDFGAENVKKVRELMNRTPWIVWMNSYVWIVIGIISAISSFFFYEMVIPVFENMIMTDEAFAFIDDFVFYFQIGGNICPVKNN